MLPGLLLRVAWLASQWPSTTSPKLGLSLHLQNPKSPPQSTVWFQSLCRLSPSQPDTFLASLAFSHLKKGQQKSLFFSPSNKCVESQFPVTFPMWKSTVKSYRWAVLVSSPIEDQMLKCHRIVLTPSVARGGFTQYVNGHGSCTNTMRLSKRNTQPVTSMHKYTNK